MKTDRDSIVKACLFAGISLLIPSNSCMAATRGGVPSPVPRVIEEPTAAAKPAYYSKRIWNHLPFLDRLERDPPAKATGAPGGSEWLVMIHTRGHPDLIGMAKGFMVRAPLERVLDIVEDYPGYSRIWSDVIRVQVISRNRGRVVTQWERKAPAFFLPHVRYRMLTTRERPKPGRVIYHHQLVDGNLVDSSDALVAYDASGPELTRVSVLNFFTPEVGPFRAIAGGKIWRQSIENAFKEDIAFRARIEHPDWTTQRLAEEADRELAGHPLNHPPAVTFTD